jgi:hypothetical protein
MKDYVGAHSVQHDLIFCRKCLVSEGILYRYSSEIRLAEAQKDKLQCYSCGKLLSTQTAAKGKITKGV